MSHVLENLLKSSTPIRVEKNHIYFYSEVDRDTIRELIEGLRAAEEYCIQMKRQMNLKKVPIYLHINSYGGCIFSALNAIDYIQACTVPVYTIIEGSTASAGTLMSVCGKKRFIRPNSHMLIHQLSSECWGKMSELEDEFSNLKAIMTKLKTIYKEHTAIPKNELKRLLKHDLWLNAKQCLEYGLVDEVWNN
jgi:ATP-dependent Clp endopeptidase proteolytic subunit ClpP